MFEVLFGNKSVEKILIFLLINGRCYGAQLQRIFDTPLTPLQKVLLRLEEGGLIQSHYEGKTRVYQFNETYPLKSELDDLLKKAYTFLPSHEKKLYYLANQALLHPQAEQEKRKTLLSFWEQLATVKKLSFSVQSNGERQKDESGQGVGDVRVVKNGNAITFEEKGFWKGQERKDTRFTNSIRWTLDRIKGIIALEHLRYGAENPVLLFHLCPATNKSLSSIDPHSHKSDFVFGEVKFDRHSFKLTSRVIGPETNKEFEYCYF